MESNKLLFNFKNYHIKLLLIDNTPSENEELRILLEVYDLNNFIDYKSEFSFTNLVDYDIN